MAKIRCPRCKRILGDTMKAIDASLNCRWCKKPVDVHIDFAQTTDYFKLTKGEIK